MKKLLLVLSLISIANVQTADQDPQIWVQPYKEGQGEKPIQISKNLFGVIDRAAEDMGDDVSFENPIPLPNIDKQHLWHAKNIIEGGFLPVTPAELAQENVTLEGIVYTLNYLEAADFLNTFYRAWLNHPNNQNKIVHTNTNGMKIFEQMNLNKEQIPEDILVSPLNLNNTEKISRYAHRPVSIQTLIDRNELPQPWHPGFLAIKNEKLASLEGLQNIPNIHSIVSLRFNNCNITNIPNDAFEGYDALTQLNLNENNINTIESDAFKGLHNLHDLELNTNNITSLHKDTFNSLTSLKRLSFFNNKLLMLPKDIFKNLHALDHLSLAHNQIGVVAHGAFNGLNNLTSLFFNNNLLNTIEPGFFNGITDKLRSLLLDNNNLIYFDPNILKNFPHLVMFQLSGNKSLSKETNEEIRKLLPNTRHLMLDK